MNTTAQSNRVLCWPLLAAMALTAISSPGRAQLHVQKGQARLREDVTFHLTHPLANTDRAVYVVGSLLELGSDNVTRAVKLVSADGTNWEITISLPVDRIYTYQFVERNTSPLLLESSGNSTPLTPVLTGRTLTTGRGPGAKTIQMHSAFREPVLHWRQGGGAYRTKRLRDIGPGRNPGERRIGLRSVGRGERQIQFFVTSGDGSERDPADSGDTYLTSLDECFLQDGELFSYLPAESVGAARFVSDDPLVIQSLFLNEDRRYRVRLPRGYAEHPERRYPVLYMYDGQLLWSPHPVWHSVYGTWDPGGRRQAELVRRGLVGEMIVVATEFVELGNECDVFLPRGRDCIPPGEIVDTNIYSSCGLVEGENDRFIRFLIEELKPAIDATYRTRPDREHTFFSGWSFGGLLAMNLGWEHSDTFGAVAPQSGGMWAVPNFMSALMNEPRPDGLRIYLDTGSLEQGTFGSFMALRDSLVASDRGYVVEGDFRFVWGFGHTHTQTFAGRRMQRLMTFLWSATRDASHLPWPMELR